MLRIFFVLEHLSGKGGVETVVTKFVHELLTLGHDPYVLMPDPSDDPSWEKRLPKVYYFHRPDFAANSLLEVVSEKAMGLAALMHHLTPPDLVIGTHVPHTSFYSRIALGSSSRIPIVSWLHNPPERFNDPHLVHYADLHWTISKGISEKLKGMGIPSSKINWISNPIDLDVKRTPLCLNRFLFIGRLENNQKRLDVLFKALSQVNSQWTLDLFGDGPDQEKLKLLAENLGIINNIRWNGWTKEPWKQIENSTALILTSDFEGMPMVIGESLARGIPVISSDCQTGPSDLIKDGYNGWLFPPGSSDHLSFLLNRICNLSIEELQILSDNAIESVENFSMDAVLKRIKHSLAYHIEEDRWNAK